MRSAATSFLLIFFALFIDALQWMLGWAFFLLGMAAPTAGGVIIGNQYCPDAINGICTAAAAGVGFLANLLPGVAQAGGAIGIALGMGVSIVISFTLGPVLCLFLAMAGKFNARYMLPAFMGEVVPMFDYIPGWTAATIMSIMKKTVQNSVRQTVRQGVRTAVAPAAAALGQNTPQQFAERRGWRRPFSDVRPRESLAGAARRETRNTNTAPII